MQLIETITNELTDVDLSLTSPLLKTKLLANRIGNQELLLWVTKELNGYKEKIDLPDYRIATGNVVGDYINGSVHVSNHILPLPLFNNSFDDELRCFELYDGIEPLERMNTGTTKNLIKPFTPGQVGVLQKLLFENADHSGYFSLLSAGVAVNSRIIKTVLNAVRNKLLDFMISLESEFGLQVKIETLQSNKQKITTFMSTTINNNGDGNLINTGNDTSINYTSSISKGDRETLKKELLENQVSENDIHDLLQVIDTEKPISASEFGPNVNHWIYKMLGKAMDTSWKIGIGTAGGVLSKAICHYYGIG